MTLENAISRLNKLSKISTRRRDVKERIQKSKETVERSIRQGRPFIPEREIILLESILFVESIDNGDAGDEEESASND